MVTSAHHGSIGFDPLLFRQKRALVLGGAGFIGSHLVRRLVGYQAQVTVMDLFLPGSGANVFNLSQVANDIRMVTGDGCNLQLLEGLLPGQDFVFNLAGHTGHLASLNDPISDNRQNAKTALTVLEACRTLCPQAKIVYTSTRQVYGRPQYLPVDELHPIQPVDYNGVSKLAAEYYHQVSQRIYGLDTCILRISNVYGPGMRIKDDQQNFIGWWFRRILDQQPLLLFGNGQQIRDLIYVDDLVSAILACSQLPPSLDAVFNLGSGTPTTLLALAEALITTSGAGTYELIPFPEERKKIDIGSYYSSIEKVARQTGWRPQTHLDDGLKKTLDYFREFGQYYVD
jgi:nucleoside-diphosphate-sugar epimerase